MTNNQWIEMTMASIYADAAIYNEWKLRIIRKALMRALKRGQKGAAQ